jgi:hypothetical protein
MRPDVLVLSLGTTRGLRIADGQLVSLLRDAGASVTASGVRIGAGDRLRRGYPVNDLIEAAAARRAVTAAVARERPRAVIFSTTTASMMANPGALDGRPYGIWLDSPARLNRPDARNAVLWLLEAHRMSSAAVVMPLSAPALEALPSGVRRSVVVPIPVPLGGPPSPERERLVVAYTPDPKAKDIVLVIRTWQRYLELERDPGSAVSGPPARLVITGIEPGWAAEFLRRRGVDSLPERVELAGMVSRAEFGALLSRAAVYLSGARWEDFGQAPLQALEAGAALVVAPAGGPFPALGLARELEPSLVAADRSPESVANALVAGLGSFDLRRYQTLARSALAEYEWGAIVRRLRDEVLPLLLG